MKYKLKSLPNSAIKGNYITISDVSNIEGGKIYEKVLQESGRKIC